MSGFKDMIIRDNEKVFLNLEEFGEKRTVVYDGETYQDISIILSGLKEQDRNLSQRSRDHTQGLFRVTSELYVRLSDLDGRQPEQGQKIKINNKEGGGGFFRHFFVASSVCEMGMLCVELEGIDE